MATAQEKDGCVTHKNNGGGCLAASVVSDRSILEIPLSFQTPTNKYEKDFAVSVRLSSGQKQPAVLKVDELRPRTSDSSDTSDLFTINSIEDKRERMVVKEEVEEKMMKIFFEEDDVRVKKTAKQLVKYKTKDGRTINVLSCRTFNQNFKKVIAVDEVTWMPESLPMASLVLRKASRLSEDMIEKAAAMVERILQGLPDEELKPMPVLHSNLEKIRQKLRQAIEGNSESSESSSSDEENSGSYKRPTATNSESSESSSSDEENSGSYKRPTATVSNEVPIPNEEEPTQQFIPPVLPVDTDIKFPCQESEEGRAGPTVYWHQYENVAHTPAFQLEREIDYPESPPDETQDSLEGRAAPARSTLQPQVPSQTCTVYSWCDADLVAFMLRPFFHQLNQPDPMNLPGPETVIFWKMMTLILHVEECNEEDCPVLRILAQGFARHVVVRGCVRDDPCPVEFCSHFRHLIGPTDITQPSPCLLTLCREAFRLIVRRVPSLIQLVQMSTLENGIPEDQIGVLRIITQLLIVEHGLTEDQARILLLVAQTTNFNYEDIVQAVRDQADGITISSVLQRLRQPPNERMPNMAKSDRQD
ncbi:uncharacterized protein LOC144906511 isoform X2 [Branchiostoma floridae x Branchiostoma belcheri]